MAWVERRLAGSSEWGAQVFVASRQRMALLFQPPGAQEVGSWAAGAAAHSGWESIQAPSRYHPAPQASAAAGVGHAPCTEGCHCGRPLTPRSAVCFHKPKMRPPQPATRSGHETRITTRKNSQRVPFLSINVHAVYGGRPDATLKKTTPFAPQTNDEAEAAHAPALKVGSPQRLNTPDPQTHGDDLHHRSGSLRNSQKHR